MIVSLALRLADHLKASLSQPIVRSAEPKSNIEIPIRKRAKVGIVGAGDRIRKIYLPIFKKLSDEYQVVGVTSRSIENAERMADSLGSKAYASADELVSASKPDFLLVAVSDQAVEVAIDRLIDIGMGVPILVETPFAWNVRNGRRLLKRIEDKELIFGVAEQTPFLPIEQIKHRLIDLGLVGRVNGAHNEFAVYAYHGLAALKAYLGYNRPKRVSAVRSTHDRTSCDEKSRKDEHQSWFERSTISFEDGVTLLQSQGKGSGEVPTGLSVLGEAGKIENEYLSYTDRNGVIVTSEIHRELDSDMALQALVVKTPLGDVRWNNPFPRSGFSDEQIAVAHVLGRMTAAVQFGAWPAYDAARAQNDMELLTAIRYSVATRGRSIKLPLKPRISAIKARLMSKLG